jgi:hypothetical protein
MTETLLRDLRQPEYLHVLLNPLPIYGLAAGLLALFVALLLRNRQARITGFIVIIVCSASAWPVHELGEQAYDPVLSMSDDQGQAWLQSHKARAEKLIVLFYVLAAAAVAGLVASWKSDKLSFIAAILVLVLGLTTLGAGGYIAYAGGRIRHREFRNGPTLSPSSEAD